MDHALIALYHRYVAAAFDQQMRLLDLLEKEARGEPWSYTISTATLTFGDPLRFEALDIGSHADPDNSWLWAWSHPHLNLTPANRELGSRVHMLAQKCGVPSFAAERQIPCDDILGPELSSVASHVFALVISRQLGFDAYYSMPFEHGRAIAVIRDPRLRCDVANPAARILILFSQVIADFPVLDHRAAFLGYAAEYRIPVAETPERVELVVNGEVAVKAKFDDQNRLTELKGTIRHNE
jgi:hypothetical protein